MPTTTAEPCLASTRPGARPASRAATVLLAGACYAALLAIVVSPMIARSRPGPAVPTTASRAKAEPVRVADSTVEAVPSARGFPVPVDDPLLVNERVYQLLAGQDAAPSPVAPVSSVQAEAAPVAAAKDEAVADAAPESRLAEAPPPPPPPRPAELPALPAQQAALVPGEPQAEAFVGVWGSQRAACLPDGSRKGYLLTAIDEAGAFAGETRCAFRDKRRTAEGWSFIARCSSPRERWTARVRLRMDGARLQWASQRGTQTYVRCERRLLTAQAS